MSELGLTYKEVVYELAYRNLTLMYKDKLRECLDKMEEVSERDMGIKFV